MSKRGIDLTEVLNIINETSVYESTLVKLCDVNKTALNKQLNKLVKNKVVKKTKIDKNVYHVKKVDFLQANSLSKLAEFSDVLKNLNLNYLNILVENESIYYDIFSELKNKNLINFKVGLNSSEDNCLNINCLSDFKNVKNYKNSFVFYTLTKKLFYITDAEQIEILTKEQFLRLVIEHFKIYRLVENSLEIKAFKKLYLKKEKDLRTFGGAVNA